MQTILINWCRSLGYGNDIVEFCRFWVVCINCQIDNDLSLSESVMMLGMVRTYLDPYMSVMYRVF